MSIKIFYPSPESWKKYPVCFQTMKNIQFIKLDISNWRMSKIPKIPVQIDRKNGRSSFPFPLRSNGTNVLKCNCLIILLMSKKNLKFHNQNLNCFCFFDIYRVYIAVMIQKKWLAKKPSKSNLTNCEDPEQ